MWISKIRPDSTFAVTSLCGVSHAPTTRAWETLKKTLCYLKKTSTQTLCFDNTHKTHKTTQINAFCGASFADDLDYKSRGGCVIYYGNCLICHYSKIQRWTSTSTAEAELVEIFRTANEVTLSRLLTPVFQYNASVGSASPVGVTRNSWRRLALLSFFLSVLMSNDLSNRKGSIGVEFEMCEWLIMLSRVRRT